MKLSTTIEQFAIVVASSSSAADLRLAGISVAGRLAQQFAAAGIGEIWIVLPAGGALAPATSEDIERLASASRVRFLSETDLGPAIAEADQARAMITTTAHLLQADDIRRFAAGRAEALVDRGVPVLWRAATAASLAPPEPLPANCEIAERVIRVDRGAVQKLLRTAGKSEDGIVSQWINRPISRQISGLLLRLDGIRPIHATIGTAVLAVVMFAVLLLGTKAGMLVGALLFQAASILDGVDGEIARLTTRSTPQGATLDAAIDAATNALFLLGLTFNLTVQGYQLALYLGLWSLGAMSFGLWLIGRRTVDQGQPLGFDLIKQRVARQKLSPMARAVVWFFRTLTGRDCFAFLFAFLICIGVPMVSLYIFAAVALIWLSFVLITLAVGRKAGPAAVASGQGVRG